MPWPASGGSHDGPVSGTSGGLDTRPLLSENQSMPTAHARVSSNEDHFSDNVRLSTTEVPGSAATSNGNLPSTGRGRRSMSVDQTAARPRLARDLAARRGSLTLEDDLDLRRNQSIEQRMEHYNHLFGIIPFAGHVEKRRMQERSERYQRMYRSRSQVPDEVMQKTTFRNWSTMTWAVLFGPWLGLPYLILGIFLQATIVGAPFGRRCIAMFWYVMWPFGKYLERRTVQGAPSSLLPHAASDDDSGVSMSASRRAPSPTGLMFLLGKGLFLFLALPILCTMHILVAIMTWFSVLFIPMAKFNVVCIKALCDDFFSIRAGAVRTLRSGHSEVIHCTYSAGSIYYLKYTVLNLNVILLNLLPAVFVIMLLPYTVGEEFIHEHAAIIFTASLLTILPLGYFIGMAVASIAAQTNFAFGAVLNATFGSLIEIILYIGAVPKVGPELVEKALIGSLLTDLLLIPGLAMTIGGLRHKQQAFNRVSAGVSSVLLLVSLIGAFTPTIFQRLYGSYKLVCDNCGGDSPLGTTGAAAAAVPNAMLSQRGQIELQGTNPPIQNSVSCTECTYTETDPTNDPMYKGHTWPLSIVVASVLPLIYLVGLVFTLKTHAHLIDDEESGAVADVQALSEDKGEGGGHHSAAWSILRSVVILLAATIVFSLISEIINDTLGVAVSSLGMTPGFTGLTLIAWVPSAVEIGNAMLFAWRNQVSLAVEIGNTAAVQVAMLQLPALVFIQLAMSHWGLWEAYLFKPVFSMVDAISIIFSVLIINYISIDGRTNYFEGAALLTIYLVILFMNWTNQYIPGSTFN